MKFRIVTLVDNRALDGFESEHGLSIYIEAGDKKMLFDTGKSDIFIENAKKKNIDLEKLDYIVISHGHYDHSGGLESLIKLVKPDCELIVGEGFFRGKYKLIENGEYKYIGNPIEEEFIKDSGLKIRAVSEKATSISDGVTIFKNFEAVTDFEKMNPNFVYKDGDNYPIDNFNDEISLGIATEEGEFLVVGCSHPGFINILEAVKSRVDENIYGVLGGTHLVSANKEWIDRVVAYLGSSDIEIIATTHCTGEVAEGAMKEKLKGRLRESKAGDELQI